MTTESEDGPAASGPSMNEAVPVDDLTSTFGTQSTPNTPRVPPLNLSDLSISQPRQAASGEPGGAGSEPPGRASTARRSAPSLTSTAFGRSVQSPSQPRPAAARSPSHSSAFGSTVPRTAAGRAPAPRSRPSSAQPPPGSHSPAEQPPRGTGQRDAAAASSQARRAEHRVQTLEESIQSERARARPAAARRQGVAASASGTLVRGPVAAGDEAPSGEAVRPSSARPRAVPALNLGSIAGRAPPSASVTRPASAASTGRALPSGSAPTRASLDLGALKAGPEPGSARRSIAVASVVSASIQRPRPEAPPAWSSTEPIVWDDDSLTQVFVLLDAPTLRAACGVCTDWRRIGLQDVFWIPLFLTGFPNLLGPPVVYPQSLPALPPSMLRSAGPPQGAAGEEAPPAPTGATATSAEVSVVCRAPPGDAQQHGAPQVGAFYTSTLARAKLSRGWKRSKLVVQAALRGHKATVTHILPAEVPLPGHSKGACFTASEDGCVKVWSAARGYRCSNELKHTDGVRHLAFNGRLLASGSNDRSVRVWDAAKSFECSAVLKGHSAGVRALVFAPHQPHHPAGLLLSSSIDTNVKVWQLVGDSGSIVASSHSMGAFGGKCVATLKGHTRPVGALAVWAGEGEGGGGAGAQLRVVSGSMDRTARVWDLAEGRVECVAALEAQGEVNSVVLAPQPLEAYAAHSSAASLAPALPGGNILVTGSSSGVLVWDIRAKLPVASLLSRQNEGALTPRGAGGGPGQTNRGSRGCGGCASLALQGYVIAAGSSTGWVCSWDMRKCDFDSALAHVPNGHRNVVTGLVIDGDHLVTSSLDGSVKVHDTFTGAELGTVAEAHPSGVTCMAYTCRHLYTAGLSGDAASGWFGKVWSCK